LLYLTFALSGSASHLYSGDVQFESRCHAHNHGNELCGFP
jgi:hypothetical protein